MRQRKLFVLVTIIAWCISISIPSVTYAQENVKTPLSINEALDIAYQKNIDLDKATLDVEKAQINADDAAKQITYIPSGGMVSSSYQQVVNNWQQAAIDLTSAKKTNTSEKDRVTKDVIGAYTSAMKNYDSMEYNRLNLEDMKKQRAISSLGNVIGTVSDYDFNKLDSDIMKLEDNYKVSQLTYESSISTLRSLLGENDSWQPDFTSKAIISKYERPDLSTALSQGISQSLTVYAKSAALNKELSKQNWVLGTSTDTRNNNLSEASVAYEQAKRDATTSIEQLYYGIDSLEQQIQAANKTYLQSQQDLKIAQLKYDLGLISQNSLSSGSASLSTAVLTAKKAEMDLDSSKADLASKKAQYAYLTGQTVYGATDWLDGNLANN